MSQEARDEARRRAEIMLAYADGKDIQEQRIYPVTGWYAQPEPEWDWDSMYYRIKPEPREFVISVNDKGFATHYSKGDERDGWQMVKVREVLDP